MSELDTPLSLTATLRNVVQVPTLTSFFLSGEIYGDRNGRFPDGTRVHTNVVVQTLEPDLFRTASESLYRVESWHPDVQG